MPGSLGGLVVSLGLNAAEFTSGLTKAEREAAKFAAAIDRGIATAARTAGIAMAALGTAALAAVVAVDKFAKQAAEFQDLSEKTGASAASLASFSVAAAVAGTSMETVAGISVKLSKALAGIDDETKAAGAAMKALGINVAAFKQLTPDQQIVALAKAFNQFADGSGKTAAALAILGKTGADALPFFKELAEGVGQVNILTDEQIKRADDYADAQARSMAKLQAYAQALSTELLPAFSAVTGAITDVIKEMLGINDTAQNLPTNEVRQFAEQSAVALAHLGDVVLSLVRVYQVLGEVAKRSAVTSFFSGEERKSIATLGQDVDAILQKLTLAERVRRQFAQQRETAAALAVGPPAPPRPDVPFRGAANAARAAAERTSEAERFLESLKRQLETTQDLTAEEKALAAIQSGRLKGLTPAVEAQILATAREIDQIKALEEARKAAAKALEEDSRAAQKRADEQERATKSAEASRDRILEANEALQEEIEIIKGGDAARKMVEQRRIANAIAAKQEVLGIRELLGASADELNAINQEIEALQRRGVLLQQRDFEEQLRRDAEALQDFKNMFADTFADAFADFVDGSKSAKEAFTDFAKSVERQITRLAAQKIGDAIFGGTTSGGTDWLAMLAKLAASSAGGGGGGWVSGGDIGGLAGGTSFWRGGPTVVGEEGPEVVNLPRGSQVIPNEESQKMFGPRMNFVINVLPGASTKTAQQAAAMTGVAVQRAMVRNT